MPINCGSTSFGEKIKMPSRRYFMGAGAALTTAPTLATAPAVAATINAENVISLFRSLPGRTAVKIWAPAAGTKPAVEIAFNAGTRMFVGSAIKTFILGESLRQADGPGVVKTLTETQLTLDASVWSVDSVTFNPPNLTGTVTQRTALEAMIMHSDNTATDMSIKHAGADNVRAFIAGAKLRQTAIPNSTRSFFGYLLGAQDFRKFSWPQLQEARSAPIVNPALNDVETLASSANDFVSYYARALQGEFFQHKQTLNEFRRILSLGDAIWLLPLPLGVSAFVKGGSIDVPGFHCVCVPGGMFFNNRWVYFAITINWDAKEETDPKTVEAFVVATRKALALVVNRLAA
jgi:beta-lactamase class A